MSVINDTWRYLVARKLWPVALLLIGAIVAVPMVLAKEPDGSGGGVPLAGAKADTSGLATEPVVALAGPGDRAKRRRVLGTRKNPFEPAATPTPVATPGTGAQAGLPAGGTTTIPGGATIGGGKSTGGAISIPGGPTAPGGSTSPGTGLTPPAGGDPAKPSYELYELSVRFGPSDGAELPKSVLKRLEALPSAEEPVLAYLGVLDDRKTAVFLIDTGVIAQGDGACKPSKASCETVHLKEGETEFFDVLGEDGVTVEAQFQLDVVKIRRKATSSASAAKASVSKAGRKIVRARMAGDGPLRYSHNLKTGRLHKLSPKAYRAAVAKSARAAKARRAQR